MFGFGQMFPDIGRSFNQTYRCYSVTVGDREDVERGGKIIMPPSALDQLTRLNIQYPMLFKMTNKKMKKESHCGVLEFVADEGRIYIPYWMMKNLLLQEGDLVQMENVSLSIATFAKFQPQSVDFLDITNPKAVLENILRSFACLTTGDMIEFKYNDKLYELQVLETKPGKAVSIIECDMNDKCPQQLLQVLETKPGNAVSIIECDMNVDFAPPVGYKEPERQRKHADDHHEMDHADSHHEMEDENSKIGVFGGQGNRLDGKKKGLEFVPSPTSSEPPKRGIPNYNYKKGTLTFIRAVKPSITNGETEEDKHFEAFSGSGQALRNPKGKGKGKSRK